MSISLKPELEAKLEQLASEGLDSGKPVEGDEAFWEERHRKLDDHVKSMGTR